MSFAVVHSRAVHGLQALPIKVEVHVSQGLPRMDVVGLPEKVVCESSHRVRAALKYSQFEFPPRRVVVNLAPADLRKHGSRYDLPIALGMLAATGQIPRQCLEAYEFLAELGLDGSLRAVSGALSAVLAVRNSKRTLILPVSNTDEAALVQGAPVFVADNLIAVCQHLKGSAELARPPPCRFEPDETASLDFADIRGQHGAARALEVAAAGRHNCLMVGSPGSGKTMLANRIADITPPMSDDEAMEAAAVRSLCREPIDPRKMYRRVLRAPHHNASAAALAGGGNDLRPGEITRAHNGILFLDELAEFGRHALDVLREPMETGHINLARARGQITYPADFQLIAAMNPCPDGSDVDEYGRCPCADGRLRRYYARLSPPLLDRLDIYVRVPKLKWAESDEMPARCDATAAIRARTRAAWERQITRQGCANARLSDRLVAEHCALSKADRRLLFAAMAKLDLSMRAMTRILKVARTIADLDDKQDIGKTHLLEASSYRALYKLFKVAPS